MNRPLCAAATLSLLILTPGAQRDLGVAPTSSGGVLSPEQAAYDVRSYDLALELDPERRSIAGILTMTAAIVHPVQSIVVDLDTPLQVSRVEEMEGGRLAFERRGDQVWIELPATRQPGDNLTVSIHYGGTPRPAPRPPWVGGFVWAATADGSPWVGVACQQDGADLWWPVKDHPSDEPDTVDLHFRVPAGLTAVSNGRLVRVDEHPDGERTFHWHVSNPANAYNITLNVAPYHELRRTFQSRAGDVVDFHFWVLPESRAKAEPLLDHYIDQVHFFEDLLGPYPFRDEKYGLVQTSYLGMEHQTAISYGSNFELNEYGFDWLHFHELAHEWWGNLVTVADWRDYWIHEGFASYSEALYAEHLQGSEALHKYLAGIRRRLRNERAVAPRATMSTREKYFVPPDYTRSDGDVNFKGSWILHTLRWTVGDEAFFRALRRFAYPDPLAEKKDGCACRFAGTEDFRRIAEEESGQELGWFFEVYLRQPQLPRLIVEANRLRWETPDGLPFPMPVEVSVGDERIRIDMPGGEAIVETNGHEMVVDPDGWVLREQ